VSDVTNGNVFAFLAEFTWTWAPTQRAISLAQVSLETKLQSAFSEPWLVF